MLFRQVLHPDLGCASYVIADTAAGLGVVVDPKRDVAAYLELAEQHRRGNFPQRHSRGSPLDGA